MKELRRIGIIGLGLIGGSMAKAFKRKSKSIEITAWDQDGDVIRKALAEGVIDHGADKLGSGFSEAEAVFLCIPVFAMRNILKELRDALPDTCILTDVGSTKGEVLALIQELGLAHRFIGGHPLAGSEKSGYSAAKANLFENAYYCLTPTEKSSTEDLEAIKHLVEVLGAIPLVLNGEEHDKATAAISHVPHVVAALLVNLVGTLDGPNNHMKTLAAGGFKDITRIASSSPELWAGICLSNKDIILDTLKTLGGALSEFEENLRQGQWDKIQHFFQSARLLRNTFSDRKSLIQKTFDILVDVEDRPGIIAVIATALARESINIKNIGILNNRETEEGALEIQFEDEESREKGIAALIHLGYKAKKKE
jgi:prephenate dehydrogenase